MLFYSSCDNRTHAHKVLVDDVTTNVIIDYVARWVKGQQWACTLGDRLQFSSKRRMNLRPSETSSPSLSEADEHAVLHSETNKQGHCIVTVS